MKFQRLRDLANAKEKDKTWIWALLNYLLQVLECKQSSLGKGTRCLYLYRLYLSRAICLYKYFWKKNSPGANWLLMSRCVDSWRKGCQQLASALHLMKLIFWDSLFQISGSSGGLKSTSFQAVFIKPRESDHPTFSSFYVGNRESLLTLGRFFYFLHAYICVTCPNVEGFWWE